LIKNSLIPKLYETEGSSVSKYNYMLNFSCNMKTMNFFDPS